jgi:hydrogenase maturation protease
MPTDTVELTGASRHGLTLSGRALPDRSTPRRNVSGAHARDTVPAAPPPKESASPEPARPRAVEAGSVAPGAPAPDPFAPGPVVLGMGNVLFGDEGVGIWAAHCLSTAFSFTPDVTVHDGGSLGFGVRDIFESGAPVLILDSLAVDPRLDDAGSVYRLDGTDVLGLHAGHRLAAHDIEPVFQLRRTTAMGAAPPTTFIGIAARETQLGVGLSPAVAQSFHDYLEAALKRLQEWGVQAVPVAPIELDGVHDTLLTHQGRP